jgi:hypothetical protein
MIHRQSRESCPSSHGGISTRIGQKVVLKGEVGVYFSSGVSPSAAVAVRVPRSTIAAEGRQRRRDMKTSIVIGALALAACAGRAHASPVFQGTANNNTTNAWQVSTTVSSFEGVASNFGINPFTQAVNLTTPGRANWIADVASGNHGGLGNWTYFVFRQTFDLTGYDHTTANLTIRWAADDSGEIFASRGSWIPAFKLNGGSFVNYPGSTPANRLPTYNLSTPQSITSGFVAGLNTIEFYVQGNGETDGFSLEVVSFTAVPTPGSAALLGLGGLLAARRRR